MKMYDERFSIPSSGVFLGQSLLGLQHQTYFSSTYVPPGAPCEIEQVIEGKEADRFVDSVKKEPNVFRFLDDHLTSYGATIVRIARTVEERGYDRVLGPLRGGRAPSVQMDAMCFNQDFGAFDGLDMGRGLNHERIREKVKDLIYEKEKMHEARRIGVVDAAKGGQSCVQFAQILRELNEQGTEKLEVGFHLLHESWRVPPLAKEAETNATERFNVHVEFHPVEDLLVEDKDPLLGYRANRGAGESTAAPWQQDGRIVIHSPGRRAVCYRMAPLDEAMLCIIAERIIDEIRTLPDVTPIDLSLVIPEEAKRLWGK